MQKDPKPLRKPPSGPHATSLQSWQQHPETNIARVQLTNYNSAGERSNSRGASRDMFYLPIFKLLKSFKLQQYALKISEMGYGEDVYRLALMSEKQRQDMIDNLNVLPGHTSKLIEFFRTIDHLYPRSNIKQTLDAACKELTRQTHQSPTPAVGRPNYLNKQGGQIKARSGSKKGRASSGSLIRRYNHLEHESKKAINESFIYNLKARRNQVTASDIIKGYYNGVQENRIKQEAINQIFPPNQFAASKWVRKGKQTKEKKPIQENSRQSRARLSTNKGLSQQTVQQVHQPQVMYETPDRRRTAGGRQRSKKKRVESTVVQEVKQHEVKSIDYSDSRPGSYGDGLSSINEGSKMVANNEPSLKQDNYEKYHPTFKAGQQIRQLAPGEGHAIITWSPMITSSDKQKAIDLGLSMNSKKVSMSPAYMSLDIMCQCLAQALHRHLDFSQGKYEFIEDLKLVQESVTDFSYKLPKDLKLYQTKGGDHEDEASFSQIDMGLRQKGESLNADIQDTPFEESKIEEDFDRDSEDILDEIEVKYIDSIREKESMEKDKLQNFLHKRGELEEQLKKKEDRIKKLAGMISMFETDPDHAAANAGADIEEVFAMSEQMPTKQEMLLRQIDLEVIESEGSQEMSSTVQTCKMGSVKSQKPPLAQKSIVLNPEASYESAMQRLGSMSKDTLKGFIKKQLVYFSEKYDFETDTYDEEVELGPIPSVKELYYFCRYIVINCKMEAEIPIVALAYLERLLLKSGILLTIDNWKRFTLVTLCLASKVWDDDSLENVHFPKVMPGVSLKMINTMEQVFLNFLDFDLVVKGAEFAKYYFILKTLHGELDLSQDCPVKGEWGEFPLKGPISVEKMQEIQRNQAKAEVVLKQDLGKTV